MEKKENCGITDPFAQTCSSVISRVADIAILVLMTVFPLIYHESYIDILQTKYRCYWLCIVIMLGILLILSSIMLFVDGKEFKWEHTKQTLSGLLPKNWKQTFYAADAAVLLFWLIALISTMQSDFFYESVWGNEGRFSGLFLLTVYVASYFVISRFWKPGGWCLELFLISGMVMCFIGITDYFQMDILDFRDNINPNQVTIFTSTVGNINTYTAYVGMIMGVSAGMFSLAKKPLWAVWYYLCLAVSFLAIITGCSDNAYLSIAALFGLLPFVLFRNREGVKRYLILVATFFTVVLAVDWINQEYDGVVIGIDSLFRIIANYSKLPYVVAALWGIAALFWLWGRKPERADFLFNKKICLVHLWGALMAVGFLAVAFLFYDANLGGNAERYGSLGKYLVFNDSWGTSRGYIWKAAMRMYQDFTPLHKIFGFGPDTFGCLTDKVIRDEMVAATGQFFDNVHNAYLHYLLTIGPIGMAAYIAFLAASCWRFFQDRGKRPFILGAMLAVACYGAQALVNLELPIATPMMWLILSIGMAGCRRGDDRTERSV